MVLLLDGRSDYGAHVWRKKGNLYKNDFEFALIIDLNECLTQIK